MNNTLHETFNKSKLDQRLAWYNEPDKWELNDGKLILISHPHTDFWQKTHYGFQADNGHFLGMMFVGDFVCEARVSCKFKNQYDQAGLMVRVSEQCWIKTAVEFEPHEPNRLGVVVTNNGYSDWSTQNVADGFINYSLKISRSESDYTIAYFDEASDEWVQLRICHLNDNPAVEIGLYACAPKGPDFCAEFEYLNVARHN